MSPIYCILLGRERHSTNKVSCREHNTMTRTGNEPRPHDPESSTSINHYASTSQNANAVATFGIPTFFQLTHKWVCRRVKRLVLDPLILHGQCSFVVALFPLLLS